MKYIITNGSYYMYYGPKAKIEKTLDIGKATLFNDPENPNNILKTISKKLRGYYLMQVDETEIVPERKIKRRQFSSDERKIVYAKNKGRCALCGKFINFDEFTIDHIQPISKGGSNNIQNLQATCSVCNRIKQDILPQDFLEKISEIIIYQMRKKFDSKIYARVNYIHRRRILKSLGIIK